MAVDVHYVLGVSYNRSYVLVLLLYVMIISSTICMLSLVMFHSLDVFGLSIYCYSGFITSTYVMCVTFLLLLLSNIPMFPFMFWLPEVHVDCPTDCSIVLASLLLKISIIGFISFLWVLLDCSVYWLLCVVLLIYITISISALCLITVLDINSVIAFSSCIHVSISVMVLVVFVGSCYMSSLLSVFSHSLVSIGLFYCFGVISEFIGSSCIIYFTISLYQYSILSLLLLVYWLLNIGFPLMSSYYVEWFLIYYLVEYCSILILSIYFILLVFLSYIFFSFHCRMFTSLLINQCYYGLDCGCYDYALLCAILVIGSFSSW